MPTDYHLEAELPEDPQQRKTVVAEAFKTALKHAAGDPVIRAKMHLGAQIGLYLELIDAFEKRLASEPETQKVVMNLANGAPWWPGHQPKPEVIEAARDLARAWARRQVKAL